MQFLQKGTPIYGKKLGGGHGPAPQRGRTPPVLMVSRGEATEIF